MKAFCEIEGSVFINERLDKIRHEISIAGKDYLLKVNEKEYKDYLQNKYSLEQLVIDKTSEEITDPIKERSNDYYEREAYTFTISYSFSGSRELFSVRPGRWQMMSNEIHIDQFHPKVSFRITLDKKDPNEFVGLKRQAFERSFYNIDNINADVAEWNNMIQREIEKYFTSQREKHLEENNFFTAINLKMNDNGGRVFSVPAVKKVVVPQPKVDKGKEFSSEPTLALTVYNDILQLLYDSGKNIEKKPSLYKGKREEDLRDQFIFLLETRYDGHTVTGEAFNRVGKTDILIKSATDGGNLFVAECKFWHGIQEFYNAISQLLNYLTWRDSKAALIIFVKNKEFSNVLKTIKSEINKHPQFGRNNEERGESSFNYSFKLVQDNDKLILLEIMVFHFDK
jgi:hypothetical protein